MVAGNICKQPVGDLNPLASTVGACTSGPGELLSALLVLSIGFGLVVAIEARDGMGIGLIVAGCAAIGLLIQRTALTVPKAGVADELKSSPHFATGDSSPRPSIRSRRQGFWGSEAHVVRWSDRQSAAAHEDEGP